MKLNKTEYQNLINVDDRTAQGEVRTPRKLVIEMLDCLPERVWISKNTTFLDPCFGNGTFLIEIIKRLRSYGHSIENIESRVYGFEISRRLVNRVTWELRNYNFKNIKHQDFLKYKNININFDVVLGNVPFNSEKKTGRSNLYRKFVDKGLEILHQEGKVLFISPQGWLNIGSTDFESYRVNNLEGIKILSPKEGNSYFPKSGSNFSYYLINKSKNVNTVLYHDNNNTVNLKPYEFLPKDLNTTSLNIFRKVFKETEVAGFKRDYELGYYKVGEDKSQIPTCALKYKMYAGDKVQYSAVKHSKHKDLKILISESKRMYNSFVDRECGPSQMTFYLICKEDDYAINYSNLLNNTKFFRYLSDMTNYGKAFTLRVAKSLPYVPVDVTCDIELYTYFNLTEEEIELIERTVA